MTLLFDGSETGSFHEAQESLLSGLVRLEDTGVFQHMAEDNTDLITHGLFSFFMAQGGAVFGNQLVNPVGVDCQRAVFLPAGIGSLAGQDIGDLKQALAEAFEIKRNRFQFTGLGRNRTLLMLFFNSSLRTRLSTQKAAMNLGMNVMVLDVNQGAWKLETERGVVMDGDKAEHLLEAIPVMGSYCDVIGVRSFARFQNKAEDYEERVLEQFIRYSGRPVFSMEAATRHPLQSFADLITIEEYKQTERPKVVMTWAPHPNALPQAVPNSFAEWMNAAGYDFVITHPEGYELDPKFVGSARVEYDQRKALEGADFVYAKSWAAYADPNYGKVLSRDRSWTVDSEKMALTNNAYFMHCLPVRRNMIVTDEVIESPRSLVIPEAANREISAQVVLKRLLEGLQ